MADSEREDSQPQDSASQPDAGCAGPGAEAAQQPAPQETVRVYAVSFGRAEKLRYYRMDGAEYKPGDKVVARVGNEIDLGEVRGIVEIPASEAEGLERILRPATEGDLRREQRLRHREAEALTICEQKIKEHGLPMKLIGADYTLDCRRIVFYFSADGRVDFRALVRDLARTFRCRIELRQIGVRDVARLIGGYGPCGRPLCCTLFLRTFEPVSIKMAKEQGLALNPAKISGLCDRLMCCLLFEYETYRELSKGLPKTGSKVRTPQGIGTVSGVEVLKQRVTVEFEDGRVASFHRSEVEPVVEGAQQPAEAGEAVEAHPIDMKPAELEGEAALVTQPGAVEQPAEGAGERQSGSPQSGEAAGAGEAAQPEAAAAEQAEVAADAAEAAQAEEAQAAEPAQQRRQRRSRRRRPWRRGRRRRR